MKIKILLFIIYLILFSFNSIAQNSERKFKIHTLAFYNLENLFDTINDVNKNDEASPIMEIKFNRSGIYKQKIANMAKVISEIGYDVTNRPPTIVGICEVENRKVVEDLK